MSTPSETSYVETRLRSIPEEQASPSPDRDTLDPSDWPGFRAQAHGMLDDMLDYTEHIRDRPVADMFRVVQHVVQHAMCLRPKAGPIRRVQRVSIWRWRCLLFRDAPEAGLDVRRFRWRGHDRRHFYRRNGRKTSVARPAIGRLAS